MKTISCVIFILTMALGCYGQVEGGATSQIDSLKKAAFYSSSDKDQYDYDALEKIILHYAKVQVDSMGLWASQAKELAENAGDNFQTARFMNLLAKNFFLKSNYPESRRIYLEVLNKDVSIKNRAAANAGVALTYLYSPYQDSVVLYALKAEDDYVSVKDTLKRINNLFSLYQANVQLGNMKGAKRHLDRANYLVHKSNSQQWYGTTAMNYGIYFMSKADKLIYRDSTLKMNYLDSASFYFNIGYKHYRSDKVNRYMAISQYNLGLINERKGNWNAALDNYSLGRDLVAEYNEPNSTRRFEMQITSMLINLGDAKKAIPLLKSNVEHYKEIKNYPRLVDTYLELSNAYEKIGNWKEAFINKNLQINTKMETIDSISIRKVAELEAKYETVQKEKLIAQQNVEIAKSQSRSQLLSGGVIIALILGSLMLWFTRRQSKIQSALQHSEIQSLQKENKLIAMQSILSGQEEERKRIAQDLHDNIGTLMSTIKIKILDIQKSVENVQRLDIVGEVDNMIGQAASEIRRISHNMTPIAMDLTGLEGAIEDLGTQLERNGIIPSFSLSSLDLIENKDRQVVVFRIIQELINNIGKHSNARTASISAKSDGSNILIEISDDGKGMSTEEWNNGDGMGTKSIKSRIEYLEGEITMTNDNGTVFNIKIPLV